MCRHAHGGGLRLCNEQDWRFERQDQHALARRGLQLTAALRRQKWSLRPADARQRQPGGCGAEIGPRLSGGPRSPDILHCAIDRAVPISLPGGEAEECVRLVTAEAPDKNPRALPAPRRAGGPPFRSALRVLIAGYWPIAAHAHIRAAASVSGSKGPAQAGSRLGPTEPRRVLRRRFCLRPTRR
jgi:hypothetical protein